MVRAGERNTWPFIPRIKAHCLVEMSLDTCVQKLRRQIARDSATNKAKLIQGRGETDKINRLPSFYTTRSIINLSGLSVGDPVPTYRPITALNHNNPNPAINSRGGPSPLAGSGYSTGAGFNNSINDYGLESDFNGKKPSSHDNLSNRTSSNSLTAVASESSPTRMSSGNLDASPKNNTINNNVDSLLDMSSEDNDELFASVPAPDMYLPLKDEKTRPSILKSSRNGLSSVVTTGSDVSSNNYNSSNNMDKNSEYTLGYSPRDKNKEASPLDPSGESNSSLYGLVPGADTLLTDSPRSSIVSSRYTRIPKPSNDETLTDEQRQQQYLDLTLTSANLGDVNAGKANDLNEKKSGITK